MLTRAPFIRLQPVTRFHLGSSTWIQSDTLLIHFDVSLSAQVDGIYKVGEPEGSEGLNWKATIVGINMESGFQTLTILAVRCEDYHCSDKGPF